MHQKDMVKSRSSSSSSGGGRSCYRGHWRPAEDDKLRQLVEQFGPQNWNFIAEHFEGRSGKSCRLRWYNQLDPNINKNPFTEEEEERLLIYQQLHGNKWALIARHFKGRTDNAVKNHYHVIMARRRRERFTIFNNKSVQYQNSARSNNPLTFSFSNLQNHEKRSWIPPSVFNPSAAKEGTYGYGLLSQGRKNHHLINNGASSRSILNCKKNIRENPFRGLSFGDGNGRMRSRSIENGGLFMKWPMGSDEKEEGNGPISERKRTLPFIDFLGMGSS